MSAPSVVLHVAGAYPCAVHLRHPSKVYSDLESECCDDGGQHEQIAGCLLSRMLGQKPEEDDTAAADGAAVEGEDAAAAEAEPAAATGSQRPKRDLKKIK